MIRHGRKYDSPMTCFFKCTLRCLRPFVGARHSIAAELRIGDVVVSELQTRLNRSTRPE
jgi:hypothetical protein